MKELILITSHAPNNEKQELLRNLVNDTKGRGYDIMLSTHVFVPKDILDSVDFMVYEKENKLLTDLKHKKFSYFWSFDSTVKVNSTETFRYNHAFAMIKLLVNGLSYAKKIGYEKVHFFEYDTKISSFFEIQVNSKMLEEYNVIYYTPPGLPWPSAPISFSLNKISDSWFNISNESIMEFFDENTSKLSEEYEQRLINDSGNSLNKEHKILLENGIEVGLHCEIEKNSWMVPVYHQPSNKLVFFGWAKDFIEDIEITLLINENRIEKHKVEPRRWIAIDIDDINNVSTITIIVNGEITNSLDFSKIDIEYYKTKNQINYNKI
jgi:hypothetical protein